MKLISILALAITIGAQDNAATPLIDLANAVVQHRLREPATASASGDAVAYAGRVEPPPPLTLELVSLKKPQSGEDAALIAEIEIRNSSRRELDVPVDPSSRDLEPRLSSVPYRYLTAHIWLAAEPGARERTPGQGLALYGVKTVPKSVQTLAPGQAVRIRASIPAAGLLKEIPETHGGQSKLIRAFLAISDESIVPERDGRLHSHTEQVFPPISSTSPIDLPR